MSEYKNVLVAVDTHGEYEAVVKRAMQVTDAQTEISLIYVHEPFYYGDMIYAGSVEFEEQVLGHAREVLQKIGEPLDIPTQRQHVERGRPAAQIQGKAEEIGADLIVMGTHGRHGLQLMLGSTANAVLHGVKCDVLAVRVPGETIDAG